MNIKESIKHHLFESRNERAVGIILLNDDLTKTILLKRGFEPHKHKWSILSGGIEGDETKIEALKREMFEEIKINLDDILDVTEVGNELNEYCNFTYYTGKTKSEFKPKLDSENVDYEWFEVDNLPEDMYPKTDKKIKKSINKCRNIKQ